MRSQIGSSEASGRAEPTFRMRTSSPSVRISRSESGSIPKRLRTSTGTVTWPFSVMRYTFT